MVDMQSRRKLLGYGAAGIALAPSLAQAGAKIVAPATGTHLAPPAIPPIPPEAEFIQGTADMASRLTVETFIDDKGPFRFVVDTGSDRTVIAYDIAQKLGLLTGEAVVVQGVARTIPAETVKLKNVRVGKAFVESMEAPVLTRQWLGADGYLGLDVIDGKRVTFDFQNKSMTVGAAGAATLATFRSEEAVVRVNGSHGRLTAVDVRVDGVKAYCFIDTGAEISIANTKLFDEMARVSGATYIKDQMVPLIDVTGGWAPGRLAYVSNVKIGAVRFTNSVLAVADLDVFEVWNLADRPALFLGMNFLKVLSAFTIDYGRKELRFKFARNALMARNDLG